MSGRWRRIGFLAVAALVGGVGHGFAQPPKETPADREQIEAALKLTQAAAAEYEIQVAGEDKPLNLRRDPILRWSNPTVGVLHGNVFLWTRGDQPLVVASLHKWFSPFTHMTHEFQSLSEEPISAKFHGEPVWKTNEPGLRFVDLPKAPAPAVTEAQRFFQAKELAKDFTTTMKEKSGTLVELRLLTQPVYRYAAPKKGIHSGSLFAFVQGTDPELFLLIDARGENAATARWKYAVTRMTNVDLWLHHRKEEVWAAKYLTIRVVNDHRQPYTRFNFDEIPEFLKGETAKSKK
ncbi:hypothetical protein [Fimbriiglobus ruber]|uniref:Uncharacterized protein n=1 Tax=Fimbriiglobus ruber TaxID=1908690 RepID=A0A225E0E8_9BACT|nr:hypothetical protein [Fimbriiglobus ruber]OWK47210.1 hypothetical protein FRUB_00909 [Fimbriiglobus ruber]